MDKEPDAREFLAARLRELIKLAGLTQAQAAAQANGGRPPRGVTINAQRISDWVNAKHVPQEAELEHLVLCLIRKAVGRREAQLRPSPQGVGSFHHGLLEPRQWRAWRHAAGQQPSPDTTQMPSPVRPVDPPRPVRAWSAQRLGVHPAISAPSAPLGDARDTAFVLPRYVMRAHDRRLQECLRAAVDPSAAPLLVTVVGESCTGKTRTAFEAIRAVVPDTFALVCPADTAGLLALLDAGDPAPGTVLWLDEAQAYLAGPLGERVATALMRRLDAEAHGPLIVMATLWPHHHEALIATPRQDSPDLHRAARTLLTQTKQATQIRVPDSFADDLDTARRLSAQDLSLATALPLGSTLTQTLAAAPDLVHHYEHPPHHGRLGRALIEAAMDARRLGVTGPLPLAFLHDAAPGYLPDAERARAGTDWFTHALAYARTPVKQITTALTDLPQPTGMGALPDVVDLADYLQHHGRLTRRDLCPPTSFWHAARTHLHTPDDLIPLVHAAMHRARYHQAMVLSHHAADTGDPSGVKLLMTMARNREDVGDRHNAEQLARRAVDLGSSDARQWLANLPEERDMPIIMSALTGLTLDELNVPKIPVWTTETEERAQQALAAGLTGYLVHLATLCEEEEEYEHAERLAQQALNAGNPNARVVLARIRDKAGAREEAEQLYRQAAAAGHVDALIPLARIREHAGARQEAERLAQQAADAGFPYALAKLAEIRERTAGREAAETLYRQAADRGDSYAAAKLAQRREEARQPLQAERLYLQALDTGGSFENDVLLTSLARVRRKTAHQAVRYGLEPDGSFSPPW